jgi:hypothetical protein
MRGFSRGQAVSWAMLRNIPTFWLSALKTTGAVILLTTSCASGFALYRNHYEGKRQAGMRDVVVNAQPVLAAIRAYEKQHKKPPETLEALKNPLSSPGPMAEKGWEYSVFDRLWTLKVSVKKNYTPNLGFGDTFVYHSDGQYERAAYGGILERFGEWGYYWE